MKNLLNFLATIVLVSVIFAIAWFLAKLSGLGR